MSSPRFYTQKQDILKLCIHRHRTSTKQYLDLARRLHAKWVKCQVANCS